MPRRRHRHHPHGPRRGAATDEQLLDPLADPNRPIPNLAAADRFEAYYRAILLNGSTLAGQGEWARFISTLHRPLPVTFRVCTATSAAPVVAECLAAGKDLLAGQGGLPASVELPWCSSWSVGVSKEKLKAGQLPEHAAMQAWLSKYSALGVLTRQAIESMVPVALLGVCPQHAVLDMCASPGSKTTQALEALFTSEGGEAAVDGARGFMVANDASPARCQMLLRRCAAYGEMCSRLLVTCHAAQAMPRLPGRAASDGSFDRIVCDVPCSGDGTTRKNPSIWHRWSVEYALEMHPLQLQIALRGAALLRVGGLIAYSTCSLNPLENESVVAELLLRCRGALELVDCSAALPELRRTPGLTKWAVLDDDLVEYASHAELMASANPRAIRRRFLPSMWPPAEPEPLHLNRCLRLLPHLADMGGFFVALLRKVKPLPSPPRPAAGPAPPPAPPPTVDCRSQLAAAARAPTADAPLAKRGGGGLAGGGGGRVGDGRFGVLPAELLDEVAAQLALHKTRLRLLRPELLCLSSRAAVVTRVAPHVARLCEKPPSGRRLRVLAAGCTLARRSRAGRFKPTVEGARAFAPLAKRSRRLRLPPADGLRLLETPSRAVPLEALSARVAARARALPAGPCLLLLRRPGDEGAPLAVPARRVLQPEGLRLQLLYTAGLEFRPSAVVHSLKAQLQG